MANVSPAPGLMLTHKEYQCLKTAQSYRRKLAFVRLIGLHRIIWPDLLHRVKWSSSWWRFSIQLLILVLFWPVIIVLGLFEYLKGLISFPMRLLSSFQYNPSLRSPGEKSLVGIHNAFSVLLDLPRAYYMECMDDWVGILYGQEILLEKSFSRYVADVKVHKTNVAMDQEPLNFNLRSDLAVAREALSIDLGHYLLDGQ